jgi:hypothetical protein
MYWLFLIGFIVYLGIALFGWLAENDGWAFLYAIPFALMAGGLGGMIATTITGAIVQPDPHYEKAYDLPLVAMSDTRVTTGSFFLGIGGVGSNSRYVYYYGSPESGYRQGYVGTERATVFEVDGLTNPRVEVLHDTVGGWNHWSWTFDALPKYKIYVPKGTIVQNFNLDLN